MPAPWTCILVAGRPTPAGYGQFHGCDWSGCAPPISGFYWKTDVEKMDQIRKNIADAITEEQ
jgi:hypothetical protein